MKKILFTFVCFVFVISSQAFSEDRFEFVCKNDNTIFSFDKNSIKCEQNTEGDYEIELKGINTVYFSPSGLLHRINFSAIPILDKDGETLSESFQLRYQNLFGGLIYRLQQH